MFQYIVLDLRVGCPILKFGHIHIFQRELNPNLFRVDLTLGKQDNRLNMGAPGEQVGGGGIGYLVAPLLQQRHIPCQGGRVAGYIHNPPGGEAGQRFNGVGIQALSGRVNDNYIGLDALLFQLQGSLAGITAEKFRVLDAIALCVFLCVLDRLGNDLHTKDLSGASCRVRDGSAALRS